MRLRQVHLDYHNSGVLKNIGRDFSKEDFQAALKLGACLYIFDDLLEGASVLRAARYGQGRKVSLF